MLIVFHQWRYLVGEKRDRTVELRRHYATLYSDILKAGVEAGQFKKMDIKVEVFSLLGALNWVPEWYQQSGGYTASEIGDQIAETFLKGFAK